MDRLIQFCTQASLYNGEFGGSVGWPAAGMGYVFVTNANRLLVVYGEAVAANRMAERIASVIHPTFRGTVTLSL